jgi:hypothetical protein
VQVRVREDALHAHARIVELYPLWTGIGSPCHLRG